ncbi:MAG TPA: hypothetical protein VFL76_08275 [Edaphocola sp.]|nr:hypothetical protein [Edaphocola sp.]
MAENIMAYAIFKIIQSFRRPAMEVIWIGDYPHQAKGCWIPDSEHEYKGIIQFLNTTCWAGFCPLYCKFPLNRVSDVSSFPGLQI